MTRTISLGLAATALALTSACAQEPVDASNTEAIEQIVENYILENPEVIEAALIALSEKRDAEERAMTLAAIEDNQGALISAADPFIGAEDAPVSVIVFSAYSCGFCKRATPFVTDLPEAYDQKVRVVFKETPVAAPNLEKAALAAIAAHRQGKYLEMHRALMELDNSSGYEPEIIDAAAEEAGLDVLKMRADMKSIEVQKTLADSKSLARTLGITGTPNFVIGTEHVIGYRPELIAEAIEAALAES
ncbi:MAG: thioredoxin domain-containing protein [Pseudomonadota bacterium]